jgi:ribosome biogenesis GTPase
MLMDLQSIGWTKFFSDNFKKFKSEGQIPARIICEQKKSYILYCEEGELKSGARGILWHQKESKIITPVVGDWVVAQPLTEKKSANIVHILPRKSSFSRKASGGRKRYSGGKNVEQVIVANIDIGIITIGLDRDFSLRRIERYLALTQGSGAKPLIILNKSDLCEDVETRKKEVSHIAKDIPVITMIALKKENVETLYNYIKKGETAALLGSSGVGKSTIINGLLGYQRQKVKEVSASAGKGQHTTSQRKLIVLPNGGLMIDNPGMREIQLWADENDIDEIFNDIESLAQNCRFRNCQHDAEPGCAVKESLETGVIDKNRLNNYKKMKMEVTNLAERQKRKK